jgi:hypothetical protein
MPDVLVAWVDRATPAQDGTTRTTRGEPVMSHYQSPEDFDHIHALLSLAPEEGKAFMAVDHAVKRETGAISRRRRRPPTS